MEQIKVFHSFRMKGFFIEHIRRTIPYYMQDKHFHNQYEIFYLLSGDRNYFIQDRVYNIKKGDLVLINSNILHKTVKGFSDAHERILIEFDADFFDYFLEKDAKQKFMKVFHTPCNILRLDEIERKQIENCFFKLMQESKENSSEATLALKVYFLELLTLVGKSHTKAFTAEFEHPSVLHKRIADVITYINYNYHNDIGLATVAGEFYISPAHLSRAFKKATGFTFIEYLNNYRISEAQKLLTGTSYSISEISAKTGFQNTTHFGRIFKDITGSTPRDYRKHGTY